MTRSWISPVVAVLLGTLALSLVLVNQGQVGVARDEATYMHFGDRYADWWLSLARGDTQQIRSSEITKTFGGKRATDGNREHPPLVKTLFGLSHRALGETGISELTAYRLPSAVFFALLVVLVYLFARRHFGGTIGVVAAALVLANPRLFFHASLATFDVAVATLWFATVFFYDAAVGRRMKVLWVGLSFGLALATKHNALMLPFVLALHYAWLAYRDGAAEAEGVRRGPLFLRSLLSLRPGALVALALGPLVLFVLWPWLWLDPLSHVADWIGFHLHHVHYNYEYLGHNLNAPPFPWHIAPVTVAFTQPTIVLLAACFGAGILIHRYHCGERLDDAPAMLLFASALVAFAPFLMPSTPVFGAEKHYLVIVPSLAIAAALGINASADIAAKVWRMSSRKRGALVAVAAGLAIAAAAAETWSAQPYALTHYSSLAGGPTGGANLGMNRQFWGYSAVGVLGELEKLAGDRDSVLVYTHDASPAWPYYHRVGLLDRKIRDAGREEAGVRRSSLAIVIHEKHFNRHDYMIWRDYGTVQPSFVLTFYGVPIVSVYSRPPSPPPK